MNGREVRVDVAYSTDGGWTWTLASRDEFGWPTGAPAAKVAEWVDEHAAAARLGMIKAAMLDPDDANPGVHPAPGNPTNRNTA